MGASPTRQLSFQSVATEVARGSNETVEAFGGKDRLGDSANRQAVTAVNAEQASKSLMGKPTHSSRGEGRSRWVGTVGIGRPTSEAQRVLRGSGDGMR